MVCAVKGTSFSEALTVSDVMSTAKDRGSRSAAVEAVRASSADPFVLGESAGNSLPRSLRSDQESVAEPEADAFLSVKAA